MKPKFILFLLCMGLMISGCSFPASRPEKKPATHISRLSLGHSLDIQNIDSRLILIDDNSTLAADGLYYASWGMGEASSYENTDGDTVDLYDASLYLLLGESKDQASAQGNADTWMAAAKESYEILEEKKVTCGEQEYTLLTYHCANEGNPYAQGVSAFGAAGSNALCIELTCQEGFKEDLTLLLTSFLNNCAFHND